MSRIEAPFSKIIDVRQGISIIPNFLDNLNITEKLGVSVLLLLYSGSEEIKKPLAITSNCSN